MFVQYSVLYSVLLCCYNKVHYFGGKAFYRILECGCGDLSITETLMLGEVVWGAFDVPVYPKGVQCG